MAILSSALFVRSRVTEDAQQKHLHVLRSLIFV